MKKGINYERINNGYRDSYPICFYFDLGNTTNCLEYNTDEKTTYSHRRKTKRW